MVRHAVVRMGFRQTLCHYSWRCVDKVTTLHQIKLKLYNPHVCLKPEAGVAACP